MILIKDGRVIDPKSDMDEPLDIIIRDGIIAGMGKFQKSDDYDTVIDARGKVVAPGLIDAHVHFRDPGFTYKEDLKAEPCSGSGRIYYRSLYGEYQSGG